MSPKRGQHDDGVRRSLQESVDTRLVTDEAVAKFTEQLAAPLPPLVIVIAALNEEGSIVSVLQEIPPTIAGLDTVVIVVDDGSTDHTGELARANGALVCQLAHNCGHGAALRAGYRIARENGARFIATLDADGQWDPGDLPAMVEILLADQADFVIGSRQLGHTENTDAVRNLGVRFFSKLISTITQTPITDSSSGLRVMRAELTGVVRQTQPQYQTSELLIGSIFQGYRVAEVPTVMRVRRAGVSHKGKNLFYGWRYSQVVLGTSYREWRHRAR